MSQILFTAGARSRRHRRRRGMRLARALSLLLIVLGVLVLADAALTLTWREPISALIASLRQGGTEQELERVEHERPSMAEQIALRRVRAERRRVRYLALRMERDAAYDTAVGRIAIPRIKASFVLIKGTGTEELEKGPGIYTKSAYPATSFPGAGGITAIAGHRTTWLEPFRHIDELRPGEKIIVTMPYARFDYVVTHRRIVPEDDVGAVVSSTGNPHVVLSACWPLFSAEKRILVFAALRSIKPRGTAIVRSAHRSGVLSQTLTPTAIPVSSPRGKAALGASGARNGAQTGPAGATSGARNGAQAGPAGATSGARSPATGPPLPRS